MYPSLALTEVFWGEHNQDLGLLIRMFLDKTLHLPRPFIIYNISELENVYKLVQEGKFAVKSVLEITPESRVPVSHDNRYAAKLT